MKAARNCIVIAVAGLVCGLATGQDARVYKWVDAEGTAHYTDRPQNPALVEDTGISFSRTDNAALQARLGRQEDFFDAEAERRADQADAEADAAAERQETRAQREENCRSARETMETYETAHRLYRPGADGEREYLTDDEIDAARASAREAVQQWCD